VDLLDKLKEVKKSPFFRLRSFWKAQTKYCRDSPIGNHNLMMAADFKMADTLQLNLNHGIAVHKRSLVKIGHWSGIDENVNKVK
jgi:hypothetical protein